MSPRPSAFAAPGMESAIIKTNGFFPLDIVYSRVPLEHLDTAVRAVPIAHHGSISRQMLCDRIWAWIQLYSKTSTQFTHVHRRRRPAGGGAASLEPAPVPHVIQALFLSSPGSPREPAAS